MISDPDACPLCGAHTDAKARFQIPLPSPRLCRPCGWCGLVSVDPADHPTSERERNRYLLHRNSVEDEGYVRFLSRLVDGVAPFLEPGLRGLDYGCGPEPVLASLLGRRGLPCDSYDPFFHERPLEPPYDFILCAEVFEHFRRPREEIARVAGLLAPQGILGVMTERWTSLERFPSWPYTSDPTHVAFYHEKTFDWICARFGMRLLHKDAERVVVLQRR